MEEQLSPLAVTHLLQHTLRSLCGHDDAQWVYAVFWRILPRNYPPPKWDLQGGIYDRTRGNRRNWILAWEDGFCNFAASACDHEGAAAPAAAAAYTECAAAQEAKQGLQPELFFKMSHDIYNYGEGLIGKVAADHSHKWVFQELGPAAAGERDQPRLILEQPCRFSSEDMGGAVPVWYQDHCPHRRQRRRRAAWLHEEGGGGPELRGDAAPEVRIPGEHPGGAAAAPVVGRVPGGRVRGRHRRPRGRRRRLRLAAGARADADGPLRPLRPGSGGRRRRGADAHRAVDEQPGGAAVEAALGRPRSRRQPGGHDDGQGRGRRRGARRVPRRRGRRRRGVRWRGHQRCRRRRHYYYCRRGALLHQRGQAQRGLLVRPRPRLRLSSWRVHAPIS
ncbi:uncharacterized protein LOC101756395 [Setaria italica]|uniref:uncharacterized protein LOC101756395 n=1 Tax=Setaria italica TaxID=4555 RepID=UPI0007199E9C|nr:uncharacterized protein LOC101756395 [Setaria italica]